MCAFEQKKYFPMQKFHNLISIFSILYHFGYTYFSYFKVMHYIFCAKSNSFGNALQFSKSNANSFALLFGQLVKRSGADGIYIK